jgi:hypothetical protein
MPLVTPIGLRNDFLTPLSTTQINFFSVLTPSQFSLTVRSDASQSVTFLSIMVLLLRFATVVLS